MLEKCILEKASFTVSVQFKEFREKAKTKTDKQAMLMFSFSAILSASTNVQQNIYKHQKWKKRGRLHKDE